MAVFKEGKIVGELTALEALCHSIVINEVDTFLISVPDPKDSNKKLDLTTSPYKRTKVDVDVSSGSPYITVDVYLNAKVISVDTTSSYLDSDYLSSITASTNNYLSTRMSEYLYKTSSEFKSCIDNFDKHAVHNFLTTSDWDAYDWESSYPSAFFNVNVHSNVSSSLLLTEG